MRVRPRRTVYAVRQKRPDGRRLEPRRRHEHGTGVQKRAVLRHQPRLRRVRQPSGTRLVRDRLGKSVEGAVQRGRGGSGIFRHRRADDERRTGKIYGADRSSRSAAGVVVRPVAVDVVYDRLRRGDGEPVRRRHAGTGHSIARLPFRLFLDEAVSLVRLPLGRADVSRPGRHAAPSQGERSENLRLDQSVHRPALAAVRGRQAKRLSGAAAERRRLAMGPVAARDGHRRFHEPGSPSVVCGQAARTCRHGGRLF